MTEQLRSDVQQGRAVDDRTRQSGRRANAAYAILGLASLIVIVVYWGVPADFRTHQSVWLEVVAYMLVTSFLLEPWYSGGGASLANAVATILLALSTGFEAYAAWWGALLAASGLAMVLLLVSSLVDETEHEPRGSIARELRRVGSVLGSWRWIVLATLALSLVSFNRSFGSPWAIAAVATIYCNTLLRLRPEAIVKRLRRERRGGAHELVVQQIFPPYEVLAVGEESDTYALGHIVSASVSGSDEVRRGYVTGLGVSNDRKAVRIAIEDLRSLLPAEESPQNQPIVIRHEVAQATDEELISQDLMHEDTHALGVLAEGSTMNEATIELGEKCQAELGQVVWTVAGQTRTYWQVTDAKIGRATWAGDLRRAIMAVANQIGTWDQESQGFLPHVTSPWGAEIVLAGKHAPWA
jgi:hypothetical protein